MCDQREHRGEQLAARCGGVRGAFLIYADDLIDNSEDGVCNSQPTFLQFQ